MTYAEIAAALRISGDAARQLVRRRGWSRTLGNHPGAVAVINVPADELAAESWREDRPTPPNDRHTLPNDVGDTSPNLPPTLPHEIFEVTLAAIKEAHAREVTALRERVEAVERDKLAMQALADRALAHGADAAARTDRLREQLAEAEAARQAAEARIAGLEAEATAKVAQAEAATDRVRADARRAEERAETLRTAVDELKAGQGMMQGMHAEELAAAQREVQEAREAAEALQRDEATRKARGRLRRAWAAWRGE